MRSHRFPRRFAYLLLAAGTAIPVITVPSVSEARPKPALDLEHLSGQQAEAMMTAGQLTSVELTRAYLERIDALNKRGPGLNAVTQLNPDALREAARYDRERAAGQLRGPGHGLPILLKDLIDVEGMYTSAGNYSLRHSYPPVDAGITRKLKASGVVILGKVGLSEYANSFGSQPSGFANLTGQVLNAVDADQNPSGSSSGTGAAEAAALSALGIGTETSGSIISPSNAQSLVGLRPTVGLVPGYGIAPISASQDTAGPMVRSVADAAITLQSIAGTDPGVDAEYSAVFGPDYLATGVIPTPPTTVPDYLSALDLDFVRGKKIGYNGTLTDGSPLKLAYDALVAAGAVLVPRPQATLPTLPALPSGYEQHKTIDEYYRRLGPDVPVHSLVEEVALNSAEAAQALKFGNNSHLNSAAADVTPGGANEVAYRAALPVRKAAWHKAINDMIGFTNSDPAQPPDPVIGILGGVPQGPQAGYPTITIPMGYSSTHRRTLNVAVHGNAYDELNLIGIGYVIEQATKLRQAPSAVNPSMYRCARTVPAPPYAGRGHCNPDYDTVMKLIGSAPALPFSLETESAASLQARQSAGTLSALTLTRAYLARIALSNAEGPATQAVRSIDPRALEVARALDRERSRGRVRGPLHGIPVLLDDSIDAAGLATSGGSIALQDSRPKADSTLAARLRAAGAIILGKANVTELNGVFDANLPEGYSSLGGQVLLPSDTDKTPAGSSAGSAAATASGLAALAIGLETGPDGAQLVAPAAVAGIVGLKPTVGLVSRNGVLPVARSQDSPGPLARTVADVAGSLTVIAGADPADPATAAAKGLDYTAGLSPAALQGKRIAVVAGAAAPYPAAVAALQAAGAVTTEVAIGVPAATASIVPAEFKRDLDAYLAGTRGGASSLQEIIDYGTAHPVEGLKYQQGELLAAQAVDLADPATAAAYQADRAAGKAASQAVIDAVLSNGTADPADDYDALVVPPGNPVLAAADRAGYPVLTVPAGYGATASSAGHNPIGVAFVGAPFSEAGLLAGGYALEQATKVRLAPSVTNPSMWRCVPGSTFFSGELCNPGDRQRQPPAVLAGLGGTVAAMGLAPALTADLTARSAAITADLGSVSDSCGGLDGYVRKVFDEAARATLSIAQAKTVVAALYAVEASVGCNDGTAIVPEGPAQAGLLDLLGAVRALPLATNVAAQLRGEVRDAGKELAVREAADVCHTLAGFGADVAAWTRRRGLTAAQAATLLAGTAVVEAELGC